VAPNIVHSISKSYKSSCWTWIKKSLTLFIY